jgi:polyhydroxybutyrate depolymerase
MSNGAMMAYRLAAEIPERIAAIVPVAGTLSVESFDKARDIPVLHIHGTDDRNVPIAGGIGDKSVAGVAHRSLSDTVKLMLRVRRCSDPDVSDESGGIQVTSYRCSNGAPVSVLLIDGGAHAWPGAAGTTGSFSASRKAWDFAKQFSKRE